MDAEQTTEQEKQVAEEESFELIFDVPDDMPTLYVNEMAVQEINTEFILTFFEVRLPITPNKNRSAEAPKSLKPKCVARIAVPVERIPAITSTLERRFKAFMKQREALTRKNVRAEE